MGGAIALTTTSTLTSFAALRALGYELTGVNADPRLDTASGHDLHLGADSPAIDAGTVIPGLIEPFSGPPAIRVPKWGSDAPLAFATVTA